MDEKAALAFVSPGSLDQQTGGYVYDRRMLARLRDKGVTIDLRELPGRFPETDDGANAAAAAVWSSLPPGRTVVVDGLALPAFQHAIAQQPGRHRLVVLVHHPLHLETGLSTTAADRLRSVETVILAGAARIVVTSAATARAVAGLGIPESRISVVEPGTDVQRRTDRPHGSGTILLCVATLTPRKGHLDLLAALTGVMHLPWSLHCVGSTERDPRTADSVRRQIEEWGLGDRVRLLGTLDADALNEAYRSASLFVLASHYEGYGMAFAEALSHGLPVVGTGAGAVQATVPAGAGMIVPPADRSALAAALAAVLSDPGLRARLSEGARTAAARLPSWERQADRFLAIVRPA